MAAMERVRELMERFGEETGLAIGIAAARRLLRAAGGEGIGGDG